MASRIRSFVAVDVAPMVVQSIQKHLPDLSAAAPSYQWVDPKLMHMTLCFLGDVPDADVPDICRALESTVANIEEFEVELVGVGAFPHVHRPRVVWVGVGRGREELCHLQQQLAAALSELGFSGERETYKPHLTLGRMGREGRATELLTEQIAALSQTPFGVTSVDEVILYASYREKQGLEYVPMASYSLAY